MLSVSYAEQGVTSFRPRVDHDNLIASDSGVAGGSDGRLSTNSVFDP